MSFLAIHHERCIPFDTIADAEAFVKSRAAARREHWRIVAERNPYKARGLLPDVLAFVAFVGLVAVIVWAFAGLPAWPESSYSAIMTDARGDAWIIDTRLTSDDCNAYRAKYGAIECRAE